MEKLRGNHSKLFSQKEEADATYRFNLQNYKEKEKSYENEVKQLEQEIKKCHDKILNLQDDIDQQYDEAKVTHETIMIKESEVHIRIMFWIINLDFSEKENYLLFLLYFL